MRPRPLYEARSVNACARADFSKGVASFPFPHRVCVCACARARVRSRRWPWPSTAQETSGDAERGRVFARVRSYCWPCPSTVQEASGDMGRATMKESLWHIHGHSYDPLHPGGRHVLLAARGTDATALFESQHPWSERHRAALSRFGPAPPAPDEFNEALRKGLREAFPGGSAATKTPRSTTAALSALWVLMLALFFGVRTPWAAAVAGVLVTTVSARINHEGSHQHLTRRPWLNRLANVLGRFPIGPGVCWYRRHVVSHHAHTNDPHNDVDVELLPLADRLPRWLKLLLLPFLGVGACVEVGVGTAAKIIIAPGRLDERAGPVGAAFWVEVSVWAVAHWYFGPSWCCYLVLATVSGSLFVACSQVAHAIVFDPDAPAPVQPQSCSFPASRSRTARRCRPSSRRSALTAAFPTWSFPRLRRLARSGSGGWTGRRGSSARELVDAPQPGVARVQQASERSRSWIGPGKKVHSRRRGRKSQTRRDRS